MTARQEALGLASPLAAQHLQGRGGDLDRALALGGLGLAEPPAAVHADEGVVDRDPTRLPVDVAPAQLVRWSPCTGRLGQTHDRHRSD